MSPLTLALQITAIGMGLVFAAIIVLCGLMYLLPLLFPERSQPAGAAPDEAPLQPGEDPILLRAAAAAVALALAEQGTSAAHPLPPPPTAIVSAWQLGMRTRHMSQKGTFSRRVRP